jgi:hypothetical protein
MKLKAFLALIGASIAITNDDILEDIKDQNSPQFNSLSEDASVVDSLQGGLTPSE